MQLYLSYTGVDFHHRAGRVVFETTGFPS